MGVPCDFGGKRDFFPSVHPPGDGFFETITSLLETGFESFSLGDRFGKIRETDDEAAVHPVGKKMRRIDEIHLSYPLNI